MLYYISSNLHLYIVIYLSQFVYSYLIVYQPDNRYFSENNKKSGSPSSGVPALHHSLFT